MSAAYPSSTTFSKSLRGDLFGGLAAGVVALPLALAFGVASGLGPAAGLYGAIATGVIAALLGGTPVQITGPTGPMTLVVAGLVTAHTLPSGAMDLGWLTGVLLLAGLLQITFGLIRMGAYIRYVPYPVISGFMSGIGAIIIVQQVFPLLGMASPASDALSIMRHLHLIGGDVRWSAVILSAATVAMVHLIPRLTRVVPASLIALVTLTAASMAMKLDVPVIGEIPSGLPRLIFPSFEFAVLPSMIAPAVEIALLGAIDSLLTSLVADNLTRTRHDSNRELVGQGVGNMVAGFIGGLPGAGATMRTVVNIEAGGRTRLSGVVHGVFLLAVLLGLSQLVQFVPGAVLAGLLVIVGVGIIDTRGFRHLLKAPRSDAFVMLLVLFLTVFAGLIVAVIAGVIVASFVMVKKVSEVSAQHTKLSPVADEPWADELGIPEAIRDKILIKHVEGALFFGFASQFLDSSRRAALSNLLVLRLDRVSYIDQTGAYALEEALGRLAAAGVRVLLVGIPVAQLDLLKRLQVIPAVVPNGDVFADFEALKQALPAKLNELPELADGATNRRR
jgi:SulP family sulfate permease